MTKKLMLLAIAMLAPLALVSASGRSETGTQQRQLRVAHIYDPGTGTSGQMNYDWFQEVAREIEARHENVSVELRYFQWDQIDVRIMADFRAGLTENDVMLTSPQLFAQHAAMGTLLDLNEYVARDWDRSQLADFEWAGPWRDAQVGGSLLGMPLGAHARVVAYNTEMFREVGLDPEHPPRNLDELVEFAKLLTRDLNGDGTIDVYGFGVYLGPARATIELAFAPLVWEFGGELWDPATKQATFADEAGVKAVQFLRELIYEHEVVPRAYLAGTYPDATANAFVKGDVAMSWGFGSYWIAMMQREGFVTGVFPPTPDVQETGGFVGPNPTTLGSNFTNAWNISISSRSAQKDLAWEFINIMLEPERLLRFPDAGLPIRASAWQRPEYQTSFYRVWQDAIERGRGMPPTAHYGELADTVAAALQEILARNADIESTLRRFQDEYNAEYSGQ